MPIGSRGDASDKQSSGRTIHCAGATSSKFVDCSIGKTSTGQCSVDCFDPKRQAANLSSDVPFQRSNALSQIQNH